MKTSITLSILVPVYIAVISKPGYEIAETPVRSTLAPAGSA